jgi:hypothetical protein
LRRLEQWIVTIRCKSVDIWPESVDIVTKSVAIWSNSVDIVTNSVDIAKISEDTFLQRRKNDVCEIGTRHFLTTMKV